MILFQIETFKFFIAQKIKLKRFSCFTLHFNSYLLFASTLRWVVTLIWDDGWWPLYPALMAVDVFYLIGGCWDASHSFPKLVTINKIGYSSVSSAPIPACWELFQSSAIIADIWYICCQQKRRV